MLTVRTIRQPFGQVITIRDMIRDYQTTADTDADPREHLRAQARESRQKADRLAKLAAFLDAAADTLEPTK